MKKVYESPEAEVIDFVAEETLATLEGMEKGPAGNTSLAAAFALAQELDQDQMIVVQETEYTGAGKHLQPQLSFAKSNGIDVRFGDPAEEVPGKSVVIPSHPSLIKCKDMDLDRQKRSLIRGNLRRYGVELTEQDYEYLCEETKKDMEWVKATVEELKAAL